jgi:glycosyltransferase involved in cell wall biosynthesis
MRGPGTPAAHRKRQAAAQEAGASARAGEAHAPEAGNGEQPPRAPARTADDGIELRAGRAAEARRVKQAARAQAADASSGAVCASASAPAPAPVAARQRILSISHGHPDFSLGGGEMAAYQLHKAYCAHEGVEAAWFLARHGDEGATGAIRTRREGEYLWDQGMGNWFLFKAANLDSTLRRFRELIETLRPTLVHFHHYLHIGLEALRVIRQVDPSIRIVMTLHELQAICFHDGQMVKKGSLRLCERESADDCRGCFPDIPREGFWLRKQFIQRHFSLVDHFVSPSRFLKERYVAWGLPAEKISIIENGQPAFAPLPARELPKGGRRNRFAFFGQINPYKGVDVLIEALAGMSEEERARVRVEIHGANLEQQAPEFREKIERLRAPLIEEGSLRWVGPYTRAELPRRLARIDWVLVPSIWWENSPMIIQEAFVHGRPVICSGIGGMAEKVSDGVDGLHVDVGNRLDWADTLLRAADDTALWDRLRAGIEAPLGFSECAEAHLGLVGVAA